MIFNHLKPQLIILWREECLHENKRLIRNLKSKNTTKKSEKIYLINSSEGKKNIFTAFITALLFWSIFLIGTEYNSFYFEILVSLKPSINESIFQRGKRDSSEIIHAPLKH